MYDEKKLLKIVGNCGELCIFAAEFEKTAKSVMRFTGNIDAKMDEKGRVFVPSAFRKILQVEQEEGLVMRRDIFVNCLVLFPKSVWNAHVDAIRAHTNFFDPDQRQAMRLFTADAENITMDSGGRILIPRRYLEHAGIKNDVRFIGVDDKIEIWNKQAADALLENPKEVGDILKEMMKNVNVNI